MTFLRALPLSLVLFAAPAARADVVGPDPESCPDGSFPSSCHGGPYCAVDGCNTDTDCDTGEVCQDTGLCTTEIDCGGLGGPFPTEDVKGPCSNGTCATGTCSTFKVCVKASPAGSGGGGNGGEGGSGGSGGDLAVTGCSCSLENGGVSLGLAAGALFAAALAGLRGRRRSRSRAE